MIGGSGGEAVGLDQEIQREKGKHKGKVKDIRGVENVNARGTIYSIWIMLRKCEGRCEARLVRSREQIW